MAAFQLDRVLGIATLLLAMGVSRGLVLAGLIGYLVGVWRER